MNITGNNKDKAKLRVAEIAAGLGMEPKDLAAAANINHNTALAYFRDSGDKVSKRVLKKVAKALGVHVSDLFEK